MFTHDFFWRKSKRRAQVPYLLTSTLQHGICVPVKQTNICIRLMGIFVSVSCFSFELLCRASKAVYICHRRKGIVLHCDEVWRIILNVRGICFVPDKDCFLKKRAQLLTVDFATWISLSYSPILPPLLSKAQISVESSCLVRLSLLFPLTLHLRNSLLQGSFGISRLAKIAHYSSFSSCCSGKFRNV